jgi:choline kinase
MKALILSAGQGKRLLPLTEKSPKCILPILGRPIIEWQIDELLPLGVDRFTVVVGHEARKVERILSDRYGSHGIKLIYNPDFAGTDNLVSCWIAREEMNEDFVLLNGDTLFEGEIVRCLLQGPEQPVTLVTDQKACYDTDDMKVTLEGDRLVDIGKNLEPERCNAESVGIILFRGQGPGLFRAALEEAMHHPSAHKKWYLSVIQKMSQSIPVWTHAVNGLNWCEVDYPADLKSAEKVVRFCGNGKSNPKNTRPFNHEASVVRMATRSRSA